MLRTSKRERGEQTTGCFVCGVSGPYAQTKDYQGLSMQQQLWLCGVFFPRVDGIVHGFTLLTKAKESERYRFALHLVYQVSCRLSTSRSRCYFFNFFLKIIRQPAPPTRGRRPIDVRSCFTTLPLPQPCVFGSCLVRNVRLCAASDGPREHVGLSLALALVVMMLGCHSF